MFKLGLGSPARIRQRPGKAQRGAKQQAALRMLLRRLNNGADNTRGKQEVIYAARQLSFEFRLSAGVIAARQLRLTQR